MPTSSSSSSSSNSLLFFLSLSSGLGRDRLQGESSGSWRCRGSSGRNLGVSSLSGLLLTADETSASSFTGFCSLSREPGRLEAYLNPGPLFCLNAKRDKYRETTLYIQLRDGQQRAFPKHLDTMQLKLPAQNVMIGLTGMLLEFKNSIILKKHINLNIPIHTDSKKAMFLHANLEHERYYLEKQISIFKMFFLLTFPLFPAWLHLGHSQQLGSSSLTTPEASFT